MYARLGERKGWTFSAKWSQRLFNIRKASAGRGLAIRLVSCWPNHTQAWVSAPGTKAVKCVWGRKLQPLSGLSTYKKMNNKLLSTVGRIYWPQTNSGKESLLWVCSQLPGVRVWKEISKNDLPDTLPPQSPHLLVQPAPHHHWNIQVPPNSLIPLPKAVDFTAGLYDLGKSRLEL